MANHAIISTSGKGKALTTNRKVATMANFFTRSELHTINASVASYLEENPDLWESFLKDVIAPFDAELAKRATWTLNGQTGLDAYIELTKDVLAVDSKERKTDTTVRDANMELIENEIFPVLRKSDHPMCARQILNANIPGIMSIQKASAVLRTGVKMGLLSKSYVEGETASYYSIAE